MALVLSQLGAPASWLHPYSPQMYLQINALQGVVEGLPRGAISEVFGATSSGRTALMHTLLAASTAAGEVVAMIDFDNTFDPTSAECAGIELGRLLWVQCNGQLDHAMKAADLIVHGGGFGVVALDLCSARAEQLQRIPTSYWHRFRLAVKNTPTALVVAGTRAQARSCAAQQIECEARRANWPGRAPFQLLGGLRLSVSVVKPVPGTAAELCAAAIG